MNTNVLNLLDSVDLLALILPDTPLKRAATTNGGEYAGPCPVCGGRDRFRVWPRPADGKPGRFWCRRCGAKGDAVSYLRWREPGLSFADACARLGACPDRQPLAPRRPAPPAPADPGPPPGDWQDRALRVCLDANRRLLLDPAAARARAYLQARGLNESAWRVGLLGHLAWPGYKPVHGLNVPGGILIPWYDDGLLWRVNVRRPDHRPGHKYRNIAGGSAGGLYLPAPVAPGRPVLATEGEFDALLAWQVAGDRVSVVSLGSASNPLADRWLPLLAGAPVILAAHDADAAGEAAARRFGALSARVRRLGLPQGKDLTDFVAAGGDLRRLVLEALERQP